MKINYVAVDELPETCFICSLSEFEMYDFVPKCKVDNRDLERNWAQKRPDWCPLKVKKET